MSEGDRNGDIARGLIMGFLIGGVFFTFLGLFASTVDVTAQTISDCGTKPNDCANNGEHGPDWWYWFRRLFAFEDTLAQWIMMAFTIAAAGLLLATLRATQKMAFETREVGEAQVRAYVSVSNARYLMVKDDTGEMVPAFEIVFTNSGQSPAIGFRALCAVFFLYPEEALKGEVFDKIDLSNRPPAPIGPGSTSNIHSTLTGFLEWSDFNAKKCEICSVYGFEYYDVFGEHLEEQMCIISNDDRDGTLRTHPDYESHYKQRHLS